MNLRVSNLMSHTTAAVLQKIFSAYGRVVSCKVVFNDITGHSCGYGFVEMLQEAEASRAMEELEGMNINGRYIAVSVAKHL